MLTLEQPRSSAVEAVKKIEEYGHLAGFKLNKSKTKLLAKNMDNKEIEEAQIKTELMTAKK